MGKTDKRPAPPNTHTPLEGYKNYMSGELPAELCQLRKLRFLNLSDNRFEGRTPADVRYMKELEVLLLHNNNMAVPMPDMTR